MLEFLLLALLGPVQDDEPFEPPLLRQPASFSGAVGKFRLQTAASPTTLPVQGEIRFTVTLTAIEKTDDNPARPIPVLSPPRRPNLEKDSRFQEHFDFQIPETPERRTGNRWEFFYILKPRSIEVKEIPEVSFCFFNPLHGQDPSGYQEPRADAIPIQVRAAPLPAVSVEKKTPDAEQWPTSVRELPASVDLLRRHQPWSPPGLGALLLLLLVPPLGALAWVMVWRRLYPDAARRVALKRSRAARTALAALARARGTDSPRHAEEVAGIVTAFLHDRFEYSSASPTPQEVESLLRAVATPDQLRERMLALLQTCDALRFAPVPPTVSGSLNLEAEDLILSLEGLPWSSHRS